ncbi:helix-turn-helix transcriptional regulator [Myceligenerans pegani]|uniref:AraC family transcriptional regulator n=1 Tax=Myceligenerans pegani TaxID=2776917 RepID=A0ABR9N578_9MICO|nr:AraC family transcriptional regulator [Myceligenerans sp. TRM 65318]MBE1878810.1 AraC family transcriptional regulator [Myceligenerans sp. TRM 65318]MBE3021081.1 AraC family transcriptional regulator [Myceligenerans sp. TRM 65318]
MAQDRLSEVFDLVEVRGVLTGGVVARGAWRAGAAVGHPLKFFAMLSGSARLMAGRLEEPIELVAGDIGILNGPAWVEWRGGPDDEMPHDAVVQDFPPLALDGAAADGAADVFVGGRIDLNPAGESLLLAALPPLCHVRAAEASPALRATVDLLLAELATPGLGSEFALRQHGQLLLLEMLRAYVAQAEVPPGWLRLLADRQLRPALDLMHSEPGHPWGLHDLARAATMSRTTFAERFRDVAGVPPLTYLSRWRMMLAQRALRDGDTRVAQLAAQLGYGSESAFSNAFKRETGLSPMGYRREVRARAAASREPVPAA